MSIFGLNPWTCGVADIQWAITDYFDVVISSNIHQEFYRLNCSGIDDINSSGGRWIHQIQNILERIKTESDLPFTHIDATLAIWVRGAIGQCCGSNISNCHIEFYRLFRLLFVHGLFDDDLFSCLFIYSALLFLYQFLPLGNYLYCHPLKGCAYAALHHLRRAFN